MACLNRMDFHKWCEIRGIPAPEFWFPSGWKLEFEMPEFGSFARSAIHVEPESDGTFAHISYESYRGHRHQGINEQLEDNDDSQTQIITEAEQSIKINPKSGIYPAPIENN